MERLPFVRGKTDYDSHTPMKGDGSPRLHVREQPKIKVRTLLTHCLYRRVIIWSVTLLLLACLMLYTGGYTHGSVAYTKPGGMLDLCEFRKGRHWGGVVGLKKKAKGLGEDPRLEVKRKDDSKLPHWLKYTQ